MTAAAHYLDSHGDRHLTAMGTGTWGMRDKFKFYYATHSKRPKCHRNLPRYDTDAVIKACGLRSISDFQLLTLERRKSVIQEVMRSLDVRPRQLSRVTGMNYETIRNIAKKLP